MNGIENGRLECSGNNLIELPNLINNFIYYIDCSNNNIKYIDELPITLIELYCSNNNLTKLPKLPNLLYTLQCDWNLITFTPSFIKYKYLLEQYCTDDNKEEYLKIVACNFIKYYWKIHYDKDILPKMEKSAKIIQRGCYNWLWKPVCKDGKPGINVKIGYKQFLNK